MANPVFENIDNYNFYNQNSFNTYNRDYLIDDAVASELNTYKNFTDFPMFSDHNPDGTEGVRSIFNKHGAIPVGSDEWQISNNVPLLDSQDMRKELRKQSGCTVQELVEKSEEGLLGRATYDYSDFMYCKYLGRLPNTYMITLRRFPIPVDDYITSTGVGDTRKTVGVVSQNSTSIGCLVTWLGTPGNEISNILSYSVSMPFKMQQAQWNTRNNDDADASGGGYANAIAALFDSTYREQYQAGMAGNAISPLTDYVNKAFPKWNPLGSAPYRAQELNSFRDSAKVYGPIDTIKETYTRSEEGLKFEQNFSLTFEYELRSYDGINGRRAMLDLIANILNVTYSTGTFWGGGYYGSGAHQNNIFTNMKIFKTQGGFTDFIDAFAEDLSDINKGIRDYIKENGGIWNTLKNFANDLGGMFIGGILNKLGRPQKIYANSLLSPAPVGFWHVMIGNPNHPIMSIGNLVLKDTKIEHYGPLGLDEFPIGLRVTCQLERAKGRDIRDIEKLYLNGNDRIYSSMGPKIFEMYRYSQTYKSQSSNDMTATADLDTEFPTYDDKSVTLENTQAMKKTLQKYFGHTDTYSIYVTACEQEYGSHKKKKGAGAGDSSEQGGTNIVSY